MDVGDLFKEQESFKFDGTFNNSQLNMQPINNNELVDFSNDKSVDIKQIKEKETYENMLKDLFTLLADTSDASVILKQLKSKYGSLINQKIVAACMKFIDIIGNYVITCRYNDDLGHKNPTLVKYVLFCDCPQCEETLNEMGSGSIDGFFSDSKKVAVSKRKICKKHNLPVLSSVDELNEEDFNALVKRVSQIKNVPLKQASRDTNQKKVLTKIAQVFKNVRVPLKAKIDNSKYYMKQANTQLKADVSSKFESLTVDQLNQPKQSDFKLAKEFKDCNVSDIQKPSELKFKINKAHKQQVNMPTNNITVDVKDKTANYMKPFTIEPSTYDDLKIAKQDNLDIQIMGRKMDVAVQKQSKYIENISFTKAQPIDNEYGIKSDFTFDIPQENKENITIDLKGDFNF